MEVFIYSGLWKKQKSKHTGGKNEQEDFTWIRFTFNGIAILV